MNLSTNWLIPTEKRAGGGYTKLRLVVSIGNHMRPSTIKD